MLDRISTTGAEPAIEDGRGRLLLLVGGTGFVGRELGAALVRRGWRVRILSRRRFGPADLGFAAESAVWERRSGEDDGDPIVPKAALEGVDVVVNLAGEGIADGPWTPARRRRLRASRVGPSRALAAALRASSRPGMILLQASAVGFYGDRGDLVLDEMTGRGEGFLADLAAEWEAELAALAGSGVRSAALRFGLVLGRSGGALPVMERLYRLGFGVRPGAGGNWVSWVHIRDVVRMIAWAIDHEGASGPVNVVAPQPVRFAELHNRMRRLCGQRLDLAVPGALMRFASLGQAELITASQRCAPGRALAGGYEFSFKTLESALADLFPSSEP